MTEITEPKIINGHVLLTPQTCPGRGTDAHENANCQVCDGGLSVCSVCGDYEAGLDKPCQGPDPYWKDWDLPTTGDFLP
jgi:hypothetical protein